MALAQINTAVGDLPGNIRKIEDFLARAREQQADLVIFPEMTISGYPPDDLLLKPDFLEGCRKALHSLAPATEGLTALVGTPWVEDGHLFNAAAVLHRGRLEAVYAKQVLPHDGVLDELRYFSPGRRTLLIHRQGTTFGVTIGEDMELSGGPVAGAAARGAHLVVNLAAFPYHAGRGRERERLLRTRAADHSVFVACCHQVGGQDELVFDGQSLVVGPGGQVLARAAQFQEALLVVDMDEQEVWRRRLREPRRRQGAAGAGAGASPAGAASGPWPALQQVELEALPAGPRAPLTPVRVDPLDPVAEVYQALVLGLRDYVEKNGFPGVVLGLSGGMDSALVAAIAVDALGAQRVHGVGMPSRYSSSHGREDAAQLAANLGIAYVEVSIEPVFQAFLDLLQPLLGGREPDVTEENLQPRIRGTLLMALSNKQGWLVLTTSNKSETSVGYTTLYGDTAGGLAVLRDVPKTLVYELARYRNGLAGFDLIPRRILEKPPSAELRPEQKDTDTLPEYQVLDPIVRAYVEEGRSVEQIVALGFPEAVVRRVVHLVDRNEYKRRQSPPGIRITPRALGREWRLPITNRYRS